MVRSFGRGFVFPVSCNNTHLCVCCFLKNTDEKGGGFSIGFLQIWIQISRWFYFVVNQQFLHLNDNTWFNDSRIKIIVIFQPPINIYHFISEIKIWIFRIFQTPVNFSYICSNWTNPHFMLAQTTAFWQKFQDIPYKKWWTVFTPFLGGCLELLVVQPFFQPLCFVPTVFTLFNLKLYW